MSDAIDDLEEDEDDREVFDVIVMLRLKADSEADADAAVENALDAGALQVWADDADHDVKVTGAYRKLGAKPLLQKLTRAEVDRLLDVGPSGPLPICGIDLALARKGWVMQYDDMDAVVLSYAAYGLTGPDDETTARFVLFDASGGVDPVWRL